MLVLVAVGILVRQRAEIASAMRDALKGEDPIVLEVLDFKCENQGTVSVAGSVKNNSERPLSLSVNLGLRLGSQKPEMVRGNRVQPYPLPAGASGRFDFGVSAPGFLGGKCLLHSFVDDTSGEAMNYTADERLNAR